MEGIGEGGKREGRKEGGRERREEKEEEDLWCLDLVLLFLLPCNAHFG